MSGPSRTRPPTDRRERSATSPFDAHAEDQPTIETPTEFEDGPTREIPVLADITRLDVTREAITRAGPTKEAVTRIEATQIDTAREALTRQLFRGTLRITPKKASTKDDLPTPHDAMRKGEVILPGNGLSNVDFDRPAAQRLMDLGDVIKSDRAKNRELQKRARAAGLVGLALILVFAVGGSLIAAFRRSSEEPEQPRMSTPSTLAAVPRAAKMARSAVAVEAVLPHSSEPLRVEQSDSSARAVAEKPAAASKATIAARSGSRESAVRRRKSVAPRSADEVRRRSEGIREDLMY